MDLDYEEVLKTMKETSKATVKTTVLNCVLGGSALFLLGMLMGTRWTVKKMSKRRPPMPPMMPPAQPQNPECKEA